MSYLRAIAHINNNPRLLLLEKHIGEAKHSYKVFYVPKEARENGPKSQQKMNALLRHLGAPSSVGQSILAKDQAHVSKGGVVRLFGASQGKAALEFEEYGAGAWRSKNLGRRDLAFFSSTTSGKSATVFLDPRALIQKHGHDLFVLGKRLQGVLGLFEAQEKPIAQYLASNRSVSRVIVVPADGKTLTPVELDFFNNLNRRFTPFGIEVVEGSPGIGLEREGPDLSR